MSNRSQNAHGGRNAERKVAGSNSSSSTAHRATNGHSPSQDQRRRAEAHNSKPSSRNEPESMEDFDEIEFGQNSVRTELSLLFAEPKLGNSTLHLFFYDFTSETLQL